MEETRIAWLRERGFNATADEIERLLSECAAICAALGIEPTDDPVEAIHELRDGQHQLRQLAAEAEAERDALRAEVESLRAEHASDTSTIEVMGLANTARGDEVNRLRARIAELEEQLKRVDGVAETNKRAAVEAAQASEEAHGLWSVATVELSRLSRRIERLRRAAGIMMLGNADAETTAICETIEAENDAESMATLAFDALDHGDVEAAKKVLRQMEADDRLCGTPTRARLAAMISIEVVTASAVSDEDALTAWRRWVVEMAGIGEDDAQGLEDETLRIAAADRWEGEAQVWKDAHGHADAAAKAAAAQRDFYRARLHAEIEAHSIRAAKEKT